MKARTPIKRSTVLRRGKPPKKRNPKRRASEFARCYGSKERVEWVKASPCIVCAAIHPLFRLTSPGRSHNAHTMSGGGGRKADFDTIVPLCAEHHRRFDERLSPLDTPEARAAIKAAAPFVEVAWLAFQAREAVA